MHNLQGTLRVYDLATEGGSVRCEINAHRTPLVRPPSTHSNPWCAPTLHPSLCMQVLCKRFATCNQA